MWAMSCRCCMPCRCWMHGHGQQSSVGFAAQGLRRCNVADSAESWRSSSPGQPDQDCSRNSIDVLVCDWYDLICLGSVSSKHWREFRRQTGCRMSLRCMWLMQVIWVAARWQREGSAGEFRSSTALLVRAQSTLPTIGAAPGIGALYCVRQGASLWWKCSFGL